MAYRRFGFRRKRHKKDSGLQSRKRKEQNCKLIYLGVHSFDGYQKGGEGQGGGEGGGKEVSPGPGCTKSG